MKKVIKLIMIFLLIFPLIGNFYNTYANGVDLRSYFQKGKIFKEDAYTSNGYEDYTDIIEELNETYYWDYEEGGEFNYGKYDFSNDTGIDLSVNYTWLHYLKDLLLEINDENNTYEDIANSNSKEDIEFAQTILDNYIKFLIDTFAYKGQYVDEPEDFTWGRLLSTKRSRAALDNITNYNASDYHRYIDEAIRKLNSALDFKTGTSTYRTESGDSVNVAHSRAIKFLYNFDQICHYLLVVYGDNIDLNSEEADVINAWHGKLGLYKRYKEDGQTELAKYSKALVKKDILCNSTDDYKQKMGYDLEQIWVYIQTYGYSTGLTGKEDEIVKLEWANMLENGKHTEFYKNHIVVVSSAGDKRFTGSTDTTYSQNDVSHATSVINAVEDLKAYGKEYVEKHQNDFSDKYSEAEYEKDIANKIEKKKVDSDANRIFTMPTRVSSDDANDAVGDAENFVTVTDKTKEIFNENELSDFSNSLYNMLLLIGIVLAVIVGMILGVKLMLAPVAEKAEAKKLLIPYAVGCAIVFGAFGIWKLVIIILQNI